MRTLKLCFVSAIAVSCYASAGAKGLWPPHFEANTGQAGGSVRYLSRGRSHALLLSESRASMILSSGGKSARVELSFPGAAKKPGISGVGLLDAKTHYFIGADRSKWRRNIPAYSAVRYSSMYPGVDLIYYGSEGKLEYDFVVDPGADAANIALRFTGAAAPRITERGDLAISTAAGEIRQHAPVIYQESAGVRTTIAGGYVRRPDGSIGFRVAEYDRSKPLVIDPVLTFATYVGGSGLEESSGTVIDGAGNVYVTGSTTSVNFPVLGGRTATFAGQRDVFVAKYNSAGTLVYAALVGGNDLEAPENMVVDATGNVAVFGITASTNFPTVDPFQNQHRGGYLGLDTFLFRLNAAGSELLASTYFGGNDDELAGGIAMDREGSIYLSGTTGSANFAVTPNVYQAALRGNGYSAFVTKISATGKNITWSTYIGGTGDNFPHGIAVDSLSNVYVSGVTTSRDFPGANTGIQAGYKGGERDAFIFKMNPAGQALIYSTYLGGAGTETNWDIAADSDGTAYVTGSTDSVDFPTTPGVVQTALSGPIDAYVVKINPAGSAFAYSTLFGGNRIDRGEEVVPGGNGTVWIAGDTNSSNMPTQNALQPALRGGADAFVAQLNATGTAILNSTYFGGDGLELIAGMGIDNQQNVIIAGDTDSNNLTANVTASHQKIYGGGAQDSFVAKINFASAPAELTIAPARLEFTGVVGASIATQSLTITAPQGSTISWTAAASTTSGGSWLVTNPARGTGTASIAVFPQTAGLQAGSYAGTLTITNQASNKATQIPVTLTLSATAGAQLPPNGIVNAASFAGGAVSAGEIVTIYGSRIGPNPLVRAALGSDGRFPTLVAAVRVLFDNVPAPLLYVSDTQLAAIVPYAVAGKSVTQVQVEYQGSKTNSVAVQVTPASPALFTANSSGRGPGAILNQDNSVNSASNPAAKGSVVVLFATGEGQTDPGGIDGQAAISVFPKPVLPVLVRIGGVEAQIAYAGAAPGLVAGVIQVNVYVPESAPSGSEVPITLTVGAQQSPAGVTLAIQ
jgi:uncharacterized protein (TIGR03437 family)